MLRNLIKQKSAECNHKKDLCENSDLRKQGGHTDIQGDSNSQILRSRFTFEELPKTGSFNSTLNSKTNLLVAPQEINKLFQLKEVKNSNNSGFNFKEESEMDCFQHDNTSSASEIDLTPEESVCNQELLMPKLRSRKLTNCLQEREHIDFKENSNSTTKSVEERSLSMGIRKTNMKNHSTFVEREIKVVKDKMLRMALPRIENGIKDVQIIHKAIKAEGGDTLKDDSSVRIGNTLIPKKRELHRLIHNRLCNYVNPDIMLVIDDHEFYCHRIVLQSYSSFFDKINNLQDDNLVVAIKEKGVTKEAFIAIYAWMLSVNDSGLKYITRENFAEVLMASQILQIRDLEEQCLALVDSKEVFYEGYAYQLFKQASKLELNSVKELMVPRIQHFFLPFVSTQEYLDLSLEDVCTFLSSSYIVVHSEMEVFMSAARWLLVDWSERKQYLPKVMNCVRFGLMNPLELVDIRKNPESPEFLKITEDSTIQKYIDDGLAYATYCTMKGSTEELKYRCELFGWEIPQPRNWADSTKCYKSYGEFVNYLKQFRANSLQLGLGHAPLIQTTQDSYPTNIDDSSFQIDFNNPFSQTFNERIPSMSDLLSTGLKHKTRRDRQKLNVNKTVNESSLQERNRIPKLKVKNSPHQKSVLVKPVRKEPSLKCRAATIIQAAYRGYRVRKEYNLIKNSKANKYMDGKKKYNSILEGNLIENHRNISIKKSLSDMNFLTCNKPSQLSGSLYLSQTPSILIFGGLNPQEELSQSNDGRGVFRYSLEVNRWERVSSLPRGRYYHNAAFLKGKVYVMGGVDPKMEDERQFCISSDTWCFNPSNGEWLKETAMKTPRKNFGLVAFQGYLYVIGGQGLNDMILSSVERYDPVKKIWEEVSSLPEPRLAPAVTKFGGSIWVAGGMGNTSKPTMSAHVYSYEPRQNVWIVRPPLNSGRAFSALVSCNDKLYLVGGAEREKERGCSDSTNVIEVFDPKLNKWQVFLQMHTPRHSHTSAVIDNCLFIMGGTTTQQMKSLSDVEIWSLESKGYKRHVPFLPGILTGHASVTLPSGSPIQR